MGKSKNEYVTEHVRNLRRVGRKEGAVQPGARAPVPDV